MNKTTAIREVLRATTGEPVIFTTGYACRIANGLADRPGHFYMTGSMGLACSIGIGVAAASGLTTVVVDGDGSLMMNPVGLLMAGDADSLPLLHVVLSDGRYASTGGQAVRPGPDPLPALARAAGYHRVHEVETPGDLAAVLRTELADCGRPVLVHCRLDDPDDPVPGRVDGPLDEHARRFRDHVMTAARPPA